MITKEPITIKISLVEAKQKEAFKHGTYNTQKQELSFDINHASGKNFRLVYDAKKAYCIVEGEAQTITSTLYDIKEYATEQEALDEIKKLGLEYIPPEEPDDPKDLIHNLEQQELL